MDTTTGSVEVEGSAARFTDAGTGPMVLLLHGIYAGAGAHEWHDLVPLLVGERTVRAADLVGFGASDRPARQFTPAFVGEVVTALVDATPDDATIVASSLTGAYALRALADGGRTRRGDRRLVLVTPTGLGRAQRRPSARGAPLESLWRRTPMGDALTKALVSPASVRWFLQRQAYADASKVTDEVVQRYVDAGRHRNAKYPLVAFVANQLACAVDPADVAAVEPSVIWGSGQRFTSDEEAAAWKAAGAEVTMSGAGLPQAEDPESVATVVLANATP